MENIVERATEVSGLLKLMSHSKRFLILCKLRGGAQTVGDLEKYCTIGQSQLSQFLVKMRDEGILSSEKNGQFVSYSIADPRILELVNSLQRIFCK